MPYKESQPTILLLPDATPSHHHYASIESTTHFPPHLSKKHSEALRQAGQEIIDGDLEPESWALALQKSKGLETLAQKIYIELRSTKIINEKRALRFKQNAREDRLLNSFQPAQVVAKPYHEKQQPDTTFWEAILTLSCIATSLSLSRLITHSPPYLFLLVSLFITTITVLTLKIVCLQKPENRYGISYSSAICYLSITSLLLSICSIEFINDLRIWLSFR